MNKSITINPILIQSFPWLETMGYGIMIICELVSHGYKPWAMGL
jgi:hypothetical protein